MKKYVLKEGLTLVCTLAAILTSVIIVLTFFTTYHFINSMPVFNSYQPLQVGISTTMALWAIRFFLYRVGKEKYIYSSICFAVSIVAMFFAMNMVR